MSVCIDLNMDVGEGLNNEGALFPYISSCNIACGGHAGDEDSIRTIITLAKRQGVKIGAHPSFPDKEHFGRVEMAIDDEDLKASIVDQLELFKQIANQEGCTIHHVKAHGALYNLAAKNEAMAKLVLEVVKKVLNVPVYAPYDSAMAALCIKVGHPVIYEAFADRNYTEEGLLISRQQDGALISSSEDILAHVLCIIQQKQVKTLNGKLIAMPAETICMHSDPPNAEVLIQGLFEDLKQHGITVA